MSELLLYVVLFFMVLSAILTVITDKLFTAVVYSGVLSLLTTLSYLLLGAPDVALAEAVIGSTLATAIFLVTLKKYRIFTVYLVGNRDDQLSTQILQTITTTLKKMNIELHVLQTQSDAHELFSHPNCDLVAEKKGEQIVLHGELQSQYFSKITEALSCEIDSGVVVVEDSITDSIVNFREDENYEETNLF